MSDPRLNWNWGVPDWRDDAAYPKPNNLSLDEWRWEFQRRAPNYREAWLLSAEKTYRANVQEASTIAEDLFLRRRDLLRTLDDYEFYAKRRQTNELGPWKENQYIWNYIQDPAASEPDILAFEPQTYGTLLYDSHDAYFCLPKRLNEETSQVAITFDLSKPLPTQLRAAERVFRVASIEFVEETDAQIKDRRKHMELWPKYLQIIDARDAGATWREIYERILEPDPEGTSEAEFDKQSEYVEQIARATWLRAQEVMNNFPG